MPIRRQKIVRSNQQSRWIIIGLCLRLSSPVSVRIVPVIKTSCSFQSAKCYRSRLDLDTISGRKTRPRFDRSTKYFVLSTPASCSSALIHSSSAPRYPLSQPAATDSSNFTFSKRSLETYQIEQSATSCPIGPDKKLRRPRNRGPASP